VAHAQIAPRGPQVVAGRNVIAFCGIGDPERFGRTLRDAGAHVVALHAYPDHHRYSQGVARDLLRAAGKVGATLVTTAKDAVRLTGQHGALSELAQASLVLEIGMRFAEGGGADAIIERTLDSYRGRKFALSRRG
nr:tetraacyldisaccharide 4'-kinase [Rhizobiaceae bacterium]